MYPGAITDVGEVELEISAAHADLTLKLQGPFDAVFCDAFVRIYSDSSMP